MLTTPYYKTFNPRNPIGCAEDSKLNYSPYDVFCIETQLYPIIYNKINRNVQMIFEYSHDDHKSQLVINLIYPSIIKTGSNVPDKSKNVILSCDDRKYLQNKLDKIIYENPDYCSLNFNELWLSFKPNYPKSWMKIMLKYIDIPQKYYPRYTFDHILIKLDPYSDFRNIYSSIEKSIKTQLTEFYEKGTVYAAHNISEKWSLTELNVETYEQYKNKIDRQNAIELGILNTDNISDISEIKISNDIENRSDIRIYQADWKDKRFAHDITLFLLERLNDDPFIKIEIPDNNVYKHYIIDELTKHKYPAIIEGNYVKIPSDSLDESQKIASLIDYSIENAEGKVLTYNLSSIELLELYINEAKILLKGANCLGYKINDPQKPYKFSCLIPMNMSSNKILNYIHEKVRLRLSNKK